jgi:hypothetical protein
MDFESGVYATRRFSVQANVRSLTAINELKWRPERNRATTGISTGDLSRQAQLSSPKNVIANGIVVIAPTSTSAIPAALLCRSSSFELRRSPTPIPKAARVMAKRPSSGMRSSVVFILARRILIWIGDHAAWFAGLDLAVAHTDLEAGLGVRCRPNEDTAVFDRKLRVMPWAGNGFAVKLAF